MSAPASLGGRRPMPDLARRTAIALAGGAALLAAALFVPAAFAAALVLVGLAGLAEGHHLLRRLGTVSPFVADIVVALAVVAIFAGDRVALPALFLLVAAGLVLLPRGHALLAPLFVGLFAAVLCGAALLHLRGGGGAVVCLLLAVWAADAGAYFVGMRWGRVRLAPSISPAKSVEGVAGGLALAAAVGAAAAAPLGLSPLRGAGIGALAGAAGPIGDLAESRLKRLAGVKDSSALLGPHGGVLDRFDAFAAAAAALLVAARFA